MKKVLLRNYFGSSVNTVRILDPTPSYLLLNNHVFSSRMCANARPLNASHEMTRSGEALRHRKRSLSTGTFHGLSLRQVGCCRSTKWEQGLLHASIKIRNLRLRELEEAQ